MSDRIELAKIELQLAEDLEIVTAAEVVDWIKHRPGTEATIAWIERAVMAIGRAKRIRSGNE